MQEFWSFSIRHWLVLDRMLPFLVLLVAICAIYIAIQSKRQARVATQVNLFYQLMARYSSPEMGEALNIMGRLFDTRKKEEGIFFEIVKKYRNKEDTDYVDWRVEGVFKELYYLGLEFEEINQSRRQVSQFFTLSFDLFTDFEVLDDVYFKKICSIDAFKFLYHVIEWLELAVNPDYNRKIFTDLLEQSGRKDIEELKELRPPKTWANVEQMMEPKHPQSE